MKELFKEITILKEYTTHTCRSAAISKACQLNVDNAEVLKQSCRENTKTFFNFDNKEIVYYAPEDTDFMSTWNIYVRMLFFILLCCKRKCM